MFCPRVAPIRKSVGSLFDKPSFYIKGFGRNGYDGDIRIKVLNKEDAYFVIEKVFFETEDGAKTELKFNHVISKVTIMLPNEDQYYGVSGVIIIKYKLKNNSRFSAKSPKITMAAYSYNEEFRMKMPLEIIGKINEIYFI